MGWREGHEQSQSLLRLLSALAGEFLASGGWGYGAPFDVCRINGLAVTCWFVSLDVVSIPRGRSLEARCHARYEGAHVFFL